MYSNFLTLYIPDAGEELREKAKFYSGERIPTPAPPGLIGGPAPEEPTPNPSQGGEKKFAEFLGNEVAQKLQKSSPPTLEGSQNRGAVGVLCP